MTPHNSNDEPREGIVYDTTPKPPLRTVDHPGATRPPTPEAQDVLRRLVNETDGEGTVVPTDMPAPHSGPRFSQRQAARKLLAGRSYQAVQAWLDGEPVPAATVPFLCDDLQRVDNRAEDRAVMVHADEIAIIVKR